jgi:hypothetical protein
MVLCSVPVADTSDSIPYVKAIRRDVRFVTSYHMPLSLARCSQIDSDVLGITIQKLSRDLLLSYCEVFAVHLVSLSGAIAS